MSSYKIIIDSCGELLDDWKGDSRYESVPLILTVGGEDIVDDETFEQKSFLGKVAACPECPKSSCPSPEKYVRHSSVRRNMSMRSHSQQSSVVLTIVLCWGENCLWKNIRRRRSMYLIPVQLLWGRL